MNAEDQLTVRSNTWASNMWTTDQYLHTKGPSLSH